MFTGTSSKIHDSRIFSLSFIRNKLSTVCQSKWHIIGDAAYPLRQYLLTPYRDYGNLTNEQIIYNKKFCATRVKIENTFGLFKSRFLQLLHLDFHKVDKCAQFIISCCVLHNICIDNNDFVENLHTVIQPENMPGDCDSNEDERKKGEIKRRQLASSFL